MWGIFNQAELLELVANMAEDRCRAGLVVGSLFGSAVECSIVVTESPESNSRSFVNSANNGS